MWTVASSLSVFAQIVNIVLVGRPTFPPHCIYLSLGDIFDILPSKFKKRKKKSKSKSRSVTKDRKKRERRGEVIARQVGHERGYYSFRIRRRTDRERGLLPRHSLHRALGHYPFAFSFEINDVNSS